MPTNQAEEPGAGAYSHIVYDNATGRIIGRFRRYDVKGKAFVPAEDEDVLELLRGDEGTLSRVTGGDVRNLAVMRSAQPARTDRAGLRVSRERQALVSQPQLRLRADRETIEGDGKDSATLTVDVVDDRGRVQRSYKGEIQITTTRGRLSERGGRMKLTGGQGSFTLTAPNETVERVVVRARAIDGLAAPADLTLRFE